MYSSLQKLCHIATENSHAIWDHSHSVTCCLTEVRIPPLPQSKQVLDLVTLEGCKAKLISVM